MMLARLGVQIEFEQNTLSNTIPSAASLIQRGRRVERLQHRGIRPHRLRRVVVRHDEKHYWAGP